MMNVSKNRCVGCGICVDVCPNDCISIENAIAAIDRGGCINCGTCSENCPQDAIREIKKELVFAVGTDDSKTIKSGDHVGMSKYFQIWKYSNGELTFEEKRKNVKYKEDESKIHGDPGKARATASVLENIDVLVGKRIGPNIKKLKYKFVCAVVREKTIAETIGLIKGNINEIIEEEEKKERKGLVLK